MSSYLHIPQFYHFWLKCRQTDFCYICRRVYLYNTSKIQLDREIIVGYIGRQIWESTLNLHIKSQCMKALQFLFKCPMIFLSEFSKCFSIISTCFWSVLELKDRFFSLTWTTRCLIRTSKCFINSLQGMYIFLKVYKLFSLFIECMPLYEMAFVLVVLNGW